MKLHTVIKDLREQKGLTQEKLAENAQLTRGYISRLEQGAYPDESPSIKTLRKIAEGLEEPLEIILSKAGITQDDYMQSATAQTFFRAAYNLNEHQTQAVEAYITTLKNQLKN
ncbi:MAG: helix-turn-helix transcriptional regulator [Patescibacteria group bacterium]